MSWPGGNEGLEPEKRTSKVSIQWSSAVAAGIPDIDDFANVPVKHKADGKPEERRVWSGRGGPPTSPSEA